MKLTNISNTGRKINLFIRNDKGELEIREDNNFFPFYYAENPDGQCVSYNGKQLKKIFVSKPSDIRKQAVYGSWESDVKFPVRYLIDKVDTIEKTKIKYSFIDIETLSKTLPDPLTAPDPISCISASNSFTNEINTSFLGDYDSEYNMIEAFINYLQKEKFDILLAWNLDGFDWPYLCTRVPDFAKKISPIGQERFIRDDTRYPAGTSLIDYRLLDKKYTLNRKREYSLNARLKEVIGREKEIKKLDFSKLSPELKQRNINDVRDMILMEKKLQYIPMLDGIRRESKTLWEDYPYNSRPIDSLLLSAARNNKIILPNKPKKEDNPEEFEAAYREVFKKGRFFNYGSYDLSGAYLWTILEFFLDPANVYNEQVENSIPINVTDRVTCKVKATYYVKQNLDLLLPTVAKILLIEKNKFKDLKNNTDPNSPEYKNIAEKYKAWKGLALSAWGVIGNKYFRYYSAPTASMITSIVRDLLHYIIAELKKLNYEIIYLDTDGLILNDKGENKVDLLNELVQKWSQDRYKRSTKISFDYEGNYEKLFIIALTRYKGYLRRPDGELEEKIVGIEAKRKNSTYYIKRFQTELLEKIMNNESKESIIAWIKKEIKEFCNNSLREISFPAKLAKANYDKTYPIFKRALDNTKNFTKKVGELFYWLYVKPIEEPTYKTNIYIDNEIDEIREGNILKKDILLEYAEKDIDKKRIKVLHKKDKPKDVQAFSEELFDHIKKEQVNWNQMIKLNILNKVDTIFEAMGWDIKELGFIEEKKVKIPSKTTQNKPKVAKIKDITTVGIEEPELSIKEPKKANMCDFKQCKQNKEGICIAKDCTDCPKNNDQSVYEKEELIKENKPLEEYYSE